MKILHVFDHSLPLHSGYTFRSQAILRQQASLGWSTCHVTSSKQGAVDKALEHADGLMFYRTAPTERLGSAVPVWRHWAVAKGLRHRLREVMLLENPDLVHAHSPALNGVAALAAARDSSVPVVYECRAFWEDAAANLGTAHAWGPRYRLSRALESYVFRHADVVTCICEGLRREIIGRGLSADKTFVVPNGVDPEKFLAPGERDMNLAKELGVHGHRVLGFVGSFYDYEGIDLVIDAMPMIQASLGDVRLLLVGGGPCEELWRAQAKRLGVMERVIFAGRVAHSDVSRYYALMDVLVYPRKAMRLTDLVTPLKPLEAMAQGKLVLASDVGGHRELIRDGETGVLFRAGDVADFCSAVTGVLRADPSSTGYRSAAKRFVENERTWANSVERYRDVYATAFARFSSRTGLTISPALLSELKAGV